MVKTVILAAGKGSRLGQGSSPKPLTTLVNGQSIMGHQLNNFSLYLPLSSIIAVVGYRKEEIMEQFPDLLYVYSPHFAQENTSKSLLRALEKCDEDVLWVNGDVVFHPSILKTLFETPRTCMVVNQGAVGEEEVKYRQNGQGRIVEVSKNVEQAEGEALGINYVLHKDLDQLRKHLAQCRPEDYFEKAIEECIQEGMAVWTAPVDAGLCTEVDFPEDLVRANALIHVHGLYTQRPDS